MPPRPRPPLALVALLVSGLLAAGCSSSERMLRISPLSGEATPDRVNLWPLLYSDSGASSVLWPVFDLDEHGFALRPLVAVDDGTWSVLYPLAHIDGDTGEGWAVPYYRFGGHTGVFPIANVGSFSWVGPVWWRPEHDTGGLFPLAWFGRSFSCIGPVWWTSGADRELDGGLFPLATFGRFNHVLLWWWLEDSRGYGLFPLFGTGSTRHLGPLWWKRGAEGSLSGGLFPLIHVDPAGDDFAFHPFYAEYRGADSVSRNALLGLAHWKRSGTERESWLLPLYYGRSRPDRSDSVVLPLFWKRTRGADRRVYTPLGHRFERPDEGSLAVYPLWWSGHSEESRWSMFVPFFYRSRSGDAHTLITPLGGYGWDASGQTEYLNVLGPLYHRSRSADGARESTAFLWPLYQGSRDGERRTTRVLPLFSRSASPEASETWVALGLGHGQRRGEATAHRFWPLYSRSEIEDPGTMYELTFFQSRTRPGIEESLLFPFYSSERTSDGREIDLLLGLGHYRRTGEETSWAVWPLASRAEGREERGLVYGTTLIGSARWPGGERFHVAGPLLYSSRRTEDAQRRERRRRILLLYTTRELERLDEPPPRDSDLDVANRVHHWRHAALFGAFLNESETFRTWRDGGVAREDADNLRAAASEEDAVGAEYLDAARHFLTERGRDVPPGREGLRGAARAFASEETILTQRRRFRLPLLYGYERTGDTVEHNGPLWMVQSRREPGTSKFRFLYYLYRSEKRDGRTSRDIFPFITADSSPRGHKFTFLWHFLHFERRGDRRGGHVLFIPWGDL